MSLCWVWQAEEVLLKLRDGRKMQVHRELEKIKSSLSNEKVNSGNSLHWQSSSLILQFIYHKSIFIIIVLYKQTYFYINKFKKKLCSNKELGLNINFDKNGYS